MADTETKEKTRDQVAKLKAEGKSAKEISEALGKTPATVYSHLRNLDKGSAPKPRGRPRKADSETKPAAQVATTNGAPEGAAVLMPHLIRDIEGALAIKKAEVAKLEQVLVTLKS